jgi:hypothetical protein
VENTWVRGDLVYGAVLPSMVSGSAVAILPKSRVLMVKFRWGACLYYLILIAQEVLLYSPISTAVRCIPLGIACESSSSVASKNFEADSCHGEAIVTTVFVSFLVERFSVKVLLCASLLVGVITNIPTALVTPTTNYWAVSLRTEKSASNIQ